jgi:dihydroorotase
MPPGPAAFVHGVKLYPAGATTNSDAGVSDQALRRSLERMEKLGMPLLVHGEVTDPAVDVFDREAVFIDTRAGAAAARLSRPEAGARAHHHQGWHRLRQSRRRQCRRHADRAPPAAQPQRDLRRRHSPASLLPAGAEARDPSGGAGGGGDFRQPEVLPRHRLGAARPEHQGSACGCAGCYTAHAGIELYAEAFDAGTRWTNWKPSPASTARTFYGLPRNTGTITLKREAQAVPASLDYLPGDRLVPLRAGESIAWRLV